MPIIGSIDNASSAIEDGTIENVDLQNSSLTLGGVTVSLGQNVAAPALTLSASSTVEGSSILTTATTFGGDVSGTYNAIVIADDSHNHIVSNIDGLQTTLNSKLSTSTSFNGDVTGTYNSMVVGNDSHTHDTRYFTESESDGRYLRTAAAGSSTQRISFQANGTNNWDTIATGSGNQGSIEVYNAGSGNDAFMAFHAGGDFALYFGLDADINDLSVGGWSMGANKYRIWHAGNVVGCSGISLNGTTINLNIEELSSLPA